jgi:hypothetical protein
LLGTADEDWWPYGSFAAGARKHVRSFVFHCHRQPLCGHLPQPHSKRRMLRLENCCSEQPSVRSLPFKIECFIPTADAAVSPLRQKTARARKP